MNTSLNRDFQIFWNVTIPLFFLITTIHSRKLPYFCPASGYENAEIKFEFGFRTLTIQFEQKFCAHRGSLTVNNLTLLDTMLLRPWVVQHSCKLSTSMLMITRPTLIPSVCFIRCSRYHYLTLICSCLSIPRQ